MLYVCMYIVTTSIVAILCEATSNTLLDNGSTKYKTLTQFSYIKN